MSIGVSALIGVPFVLLAILGLRGGIALTDERSSLVASFMPAIVSYLGGAAGESAFMAATDAKGNVYVTGWTDSDDLPTLNAAQSSGRGGRDAFVAAFTQTGSVIYVSYLGGSGDDRGYYLRADALGNVFVVGSTNSLDFPTTQAWQPNYGGGSSDGFLTILDRTGQIATSTYLGGRYYDVANLDAIDPNGGLVIGGNTSSPGLASGPGVPQPTKAAGVDGWVLRMDGAGRSVTWSTYLGGSDSDRPFGLQADRYGNVFVACLTSSADFPVAGAFQPIYAGGQDITLTKYSATSLLSWSSYFGGPGLDRPNGVDVDAAGNVYVVGKTTSDGLPLLNPVQSTRGGGEDGFVASFGSSGNLRYSSYLGGTGDDWFGGVAVDPAGQAYAVGGTKSDRMPTPGGAQTVRGGFGDGYLALFSASGRTISYGTYLGGSYTDGVAGAAIAPDGSLWLVGRTKSLNFPTLNPVQHSLAGAFDGWFARLAATP